MPHTGVLVNVVGSWVGLTVCVRPSLPLSLSHSPSKEMPEGKKRFADNWSSLRCVGFVCTHFLPLFLLSPKLFPLTITDYVDDVKQYLLLLSCM